MWEGGCLFLPRYSAIAETLIEVKSVWPFHRQASALTARHPPTYHLHLHLHLLNQSPDRHLQFSAIHNWLFSTVTPYKSIPLYQNCCIFHNSQITPPKNQICRNSSTSQSSAKNSLKPSSTAPRLLAVQKILEIDEDGLSSRHHNTGEFGAKDAPVGSDQL